VGFAHLLRGLAALLVVVFHQGQLFWARNAVASAISFTPPLPSPVLPAGAAALEWLRAHGNLNLGTVGVGLFFLISGFVIPMALERYSAHGFLVARFFRLYPTYAASR
jgi:peptidoglycan/LPS O-acetylase OafA/YrhL